MLANFAQNFDNPILQLKPKNLEFIAVRRHKGAFSDILFSHSSNFVQTNQNSPFFAHFTQDFAQAMNKIARALPAMPTTFRNSGVALLCSMSGNQCGGCSWFTGFLIFY